MCEVLKEDLWISDFEAMLAIIGEDNQNASLDMGTNEMEVLQLLSSELEQHRVAKTDPQERFDLVIAKARTLFGSQSYSMGDFTRLFNFALRVGHQLCKNMSELHFSLINPALLRCRPAEFGTVAKLDEVSAHCKVALIVALYLGAPAAGDNGARQQVSGVASVCTSLKKETVESLKETPGILKTAEEFLKRVLRHYKVDVNRATVKQLLHSRARLYYRVGRLLQGWPESEIRLQRELSSVESKYASDLLVARAFEKAPGILYAMPPMEQTIEITPTKRKEPVDELKPLLATPVHLDSEGSVAVTPQVEAEMRGVMVGSLVTFNHDGERKQGRLANMLADDPANGQVVLDGAGEPLNIPLSELTPVEAASCEATAAYEVPASKCKSLEYAAWSEYGPELWKRIASHVLLHSFVITQSSVNAVEVMASDSSCPVLWQARALKDIEARGIILVPYTKGNWIPFEDGEKLKHPASLHPALPFVSVCEVGAEKCGDTTKLILRSPLIRDKIGSEAPAPFWCVLAGKAEHANMKFEECTIAIATPSVKVKGGSKMRQKSTSLAVKFQVLTNNKSVKRGECLVVPREA